MEDEDDADILQDILSGNNGAFAPMEILNLDLSECGDSPVFLLKQAVLCLDNSPEKTLKLTQSLISLSTDKFYAFPYKDVPRCWRRLYVDASLVRAISQKRLGVIVVETLDMALIMAGGEGRQKQIHRLLENARTGIPGCKFRVPEVFAIETPIVNLQYPIPRVDAPSFEWFQTHMESYHTPLILTEILSHWNALKVMAIPTILAPPNPQRNPSRPHRIRRNLCLADMDAKTHPLLLLPTAPSPPPDSPTRIPSTT